VDARADIKSLDRAGLSGVLADLGQPAWRTGQLVRWLYARNAASFDEMTDLPEPLRGELSRRYALSRPQVVARQVSADGTRKYLLRIDDGVEIEAVGLAGKRLTVCFSTQAGCAMGCAFCATGASGFVRDLGPGEIADQVRLVGDDFGRRVSNAVAMGQGEPFANYDNTLAGLRFLNSPDGLGIGARHLTVSTCGLIAGIERLSREPEQFTLAVSLHSAVQSTRDRLMPGVRAMKLGPLRSALVSYAEHTGRRPSLEYALIEGVNDSDEELDALRRFCSGLLVHVNLIPVNPVAGERFSRPSRDRARVFSERLTEVGVESSIRAERGADIDAACGQLRQRRLGDAAV
jgi:23S rRNA (adenine2503-C2)-methyltransferase